MLMFLKSRLGLSIIAGALVALVLGGFLFSAKMQNRSLKKERDRYEQLYTKEKLAHQGTEINYRRATEEARRADAANAARVKAEQERANNETIASLRARLADARLRAANAAARANSGGSGNAAVSGVPNASGGTDQASGEDRLPPADALIATEQAIQLDELIKWVKRQAGIDVGNNQ